MRKETKTIRPRRRRTLSRARAAVQRVKKTRPAAAVYRLLVDRQKLLGSLSKPSLATYLNDHLAGSQMVLSLLNAIQAREPVAETAKFAQALKDVIEEERGVLMRLLAELNYSTSWTRRACGWLASRLAQLKLALDGDTNFFLFEAFETIAVGVEGKRRLWQSLRAIAPGLVAAPTLDRLEASALEQARQLESLRLQLAQLALTETDQTASAVTPAAEAL